MKYPKVKLLGSLVVLCVSASVNASVLSPVTVSATGTYNGLVYINDGTFPGEFSQWQTSTTWWSGEGPKFTIDYGSTYNITDVTLSVDNNDDYRVEWSNDNASWNQLFSISRHYGEVSWGMDTMSTDNMNIAEYISNIDFAPVEAQFLRIFATGGDRLYSVGEFQASGTDVSAVPVPTAFWLMGSGIIGLLSISRKNKDRSVVVA